VEVVLDTTALRADLRMEGGSFAVLIREARLGRFRLVVPELVILETVNLLRREVEKAKARLLSAAQDMKQLTGSDGPLANDIPNPETVASQYESTLRTKLAEFKTLIPGLPSVSHQAVLARALRRRKPFKEKGEGYNDALLWETVCERAKESQVAFITSNWRDFSISNEDRALHSDLVRDLDESGISKGNVVLFADLKEFIANRVASANEVVQHVQRLLRDDSDFQFEFFRVLRQALDKYFPGSEIETPFRQFEDATVSAFDIDTDRVDVLDAHLLEGAEVLLEVSADVDADVDGFVHKSEMYDLPDEFGVTDPDWSESSAWVSRPLTLRVALEVRFDTETHDIGDVSVWSVEVINLGYPT
jgi:hypothetical protein